MLWTGVDDHEDEGRKELVSAGRSVLREMEGREKVGTASGEAGELVLRSLLLVHGP